MYVFNLKRDAVDSRDILFKSVLPKESLPKSVNLSSLLPPVFDQGDMGTCAAHALMECIMYCLKKDNNVTEFKTNPSRLFLYANARLLDGTPITEDGGCSLRSMFKSCSKNFACDETDFPYQKSLLLVKPKASVYKLALQNRRTFQYISVPQDLNSLKSCLNQRYPISFGMILKESFCAKKTMDTGLVPVPKPSESELGGHAMVLVGYRDDLQLFLVMNSWGTSVGLKAQRGFFYIPYSMILDSDSTFDFWSPRFFD
jgi:C1A family cysteine protease